jgi:hypothetical protein
VGKDHDEKADAVAEIGDHAGAWYALERGLQHGLREYREPDGDAGGKRRPPQCGKLARKLRLAFEANDLVDHGGPQAAAFLDRLGFLTGQAFLGLRFVCACAFLGHGFPCRESTFA